MELFHISKYISVPVCAVLVWLLVVRGDYKSVEKVFLAASVFYIAYIITGVLSGPSWREAMLATVKLPPAGCVAYTGIRLDDDRGDRHDDCAVDAVLSAVVGGGEGCRGKGLCGVPAGCDRGIDLHRCRGVVHRGGMCGDALRARRRAAECAVGRGGGDEAAGRRSMPTCCSRSDLFNASFFAASVLPLSTAYTVCEGLGLESGVDKSFREAPAFYWLYTLLIAGGAGVVLLPNIRPMKVVVETQVLSGVLLPVILVMMLLLINRKDLMGTFVNPRWMNVIAWATAAVVVVLSVALMFVA